MSNQLQHKLSQFESKPPAGAWDRIVAALDQEPLHAVGSRLSVFETTPGDGIWNVILQKLDQAVPAKVIPFYQKYARHLKYGSAVVIFGFITLIAGLLVNKRTESEVPASPMVKTDRPIAKPKLQNLPDHSADVAVNRTSPQTTAYTASNTNHFQSRREIRKLSPLVLGMSTSINYVLPRIAERSNLLSFSIQDKYMPYSKEDGHAVKLPKRLYDAITCPDQDVTCLQKLRKVQEKIASASLTADFAGVLEIVNNLSENQ